MTSMRMKEPKLVLKAVTDSGLCLCSPNSHTLACVITVSIEIRCCSDYVCCILEAKNSVPIQYGVVFRWGWTGRENLRVCESISTCRFSHSLVTWVHISFRCCTHAGLKYIRREVLRVSMSKLVRKHAAITYIHTGHTKHIQNRESYVD